MARTFEYTLDRRIVNRILLWMLRFGLAPSSYYLLTVRGRKTGNPHKVPVALVEEEHKRWLVAPYGVVDWVKNARASGIVNLSRQAQSGDFRINELPPEAAAPILKKYLQKFPITESYFDASTDSALDNFIEEARSKPVFELTEIKSKEEGN